MKKMLLSVFAGFSSFFVQAQVAADQAGAVSSGSETVNTLYTVIIAVTAALFIFIIIYALARAVKALTSQFDA